MIETYDEALELLQEAREAYRCGEYREALRIYRELAHWVTSSRARGSVPAEQLQPLMRDVRREIAGYQNCDDEYAWESASSLQTLFPAE